MPAGYHLASSLACWKSWITWFQTIELEKKTLSKQNDTRVATDRKKQMAKAAPGAAASTPHLGA
jgi:hypothetical protein